MTYETLKVAIGEDRVGIITMNRPEVRNAMNTQMMTDLRDLFAGFYVDHDVAACLVLTGAQGAFCSGGDLRERKGMTRRHLAPAARHRRADGAGDARLPDPHHRRGQRPGLRRRHGGRAGQRLRLRGAIGALRPDGGDAGHPAGGVRHPEPAPRGRRAPRQGADPHRHAVQRRAGLRVGHGQQGLPRRPADEPR